MDLLSRGSWFSRSVDLALTSLTRSKSERQQGCLSPLRGSEGEYISGTFRLPAALSSTWLQIPHSYFLVSGHWVLSPSSIFQASNGSPVHLMLSEGKKT